MSNLSGIKEVFQFLDFLLRFGVINIDIRFLFLSGFLGKSLKVIFNLFSECLLGVFEVLCPFFEVFC